MNKLTDKKHINRLIFLSAAAYFISYLTRLNYAAVVSAFVSETGISKDLAALPVTGLFITYGAGQLLSGYVGDRVPPRHIITFGFILTTLMNFIMPFAPNITVMTVVWCVNGFAQAMMWPPLVKIMTCAFTDKVYRRACVLVSYGSSCGTIAVYLLAPMFVSLSGWKTMFFFSGAAGLLMIFIWNLANSALERAGMPTPVVSRNRDKAETEKVQEKAPSAGGTRAVVASLGVSLLFIMLAIIMQGMIRDGVTTWLPSLINETYHLGNSISILSGVVLPVFAIVSYEVTSFFNRKWLKNELACSAFIAGISFVCSLLLYFFMGGSAIVSILLCAVTVACMHGVNLILICLLPASFTRFGNVSMISGLLNFCTYVGSAASTYGMAKISELYGWGATLLSWVAITFACMVFCLLCIRRWTRFTREGQEQKD